MLPFKILVLPIVFPAGHPWQGLQQLMWQSHCVVPHHLAGTEPYMVLSTLASWLPLGPQKLWWILIINYTFMIFFAWMRIMPLLPWCCRHNLSLSTYSFHTVGLWHCRRLVPAVSKDETGLNVLFHAAQRFVGSFSRGSVSDYKDLAYTSVTRL